MSVVAGQFNEITVNHPELGTKTFNPKSKEDFTLDLGGMRSDDDKNLIDAGGKMIDKMNQTRWMFKGKISNDPNTSEDHEFIVALAASPIQGVWTFTHVSLAVYKGTGKPVGDIEASLSDGTMDINIAGGGGMKKISG